MNESGRDVEQAVRDGVLVFEDVEGQAMSQHIWLCVRCARQVTQKDVASLVMSVPQTDINPGFYQRMQEERKLRIEELKAAYNCPVLQFHESNCATSGTTSVIVSCPMFIDKNRIKPQGE